MKKEIRSFTRRVRGIVSFVLVVTMICFAMAGCSEKNDEDVNETLVDTPHVDESETSIEYIIAEEESTEEIESEVEDTPTEFAAFYDGVFKMEYTVHQEFSSENNTKKTDYHIIIEVDGDYHCLRVNGYKRDFVLAHDGEYSYLITDQGQYRWKEDEPHVTGFPTPWAHGPMETIMRHVEWYEGISPSSYNKYEDIPYEMHWDMDTHYIYRLMVVDTHYDVYELVSHAFSPDDYDKYEDLSIREVTTRDFTDIPDALEKLLGLK